MWSDGSTTQIFHPLLDKMPMEQVQSYRGTMEMRSESGDCQIQLAFQLSVVLGGDLCGGGHVRDVRVRGDR